MRALTMLLLLSSEEKRFFERRDVDFWNTRPRAEPPAALWTEGSLPGPVKELLEHPTRENAEAYRAWQGERLKKLRAAIAALEEAKPGKPASILYFARDGCRFCALQEEELRGLPVTRVPATSPLWKRYEVKVTPTLVAGDRIFRGLVSRAALLKELSHE